MKQLSLLSDEADLGEVKHSGRRLDPDSEQLLCLFEAERLTQGAHPRSVAREVSQLRAVAREAGTAGEPLALRVLLANLALIAHVLCEPRQLVARSTGRARLLAVQRFIQVMAKSLGRQPAQDLVELDSLLPARRSTGWHDRGTLVAGSTARRRRRGPTLDAADLRRIVDAAGAGSGGHAVRDRALAALHCFTGLRPEEIVGLRWEHLTHGLSPTGTYGLHATVERGAGRVRLMLPTPAGDALGHLVDTLDHPVEELVGPVFRARGLETNPLSYRAARDVIERACRNAGIKLVDSVSLRAGCAYWLRGQGLSDAEIAAVMGLARVRSVDRLLQGHAALEAQRTVRLILSR